MALHLAHMKDLTGCFDACSDGRLAHHPPLGEGRPLVAGGAPPAAGPWRSTMDGTHSQQAGSCGSLLCANLSPVPHVIMSSCHHVCVCIRTDCERCASLPVPPAAAAAASSRRAETHYAPRALSPERLRPSCCTSRAPRGAAPGDAVLSDREAMSEYRELMRGPSGP